MKKRILSLLCVFTMVLSLFPASAFATEEVDFSLGLTATPSAHTMTTLRTGDTVTVSVLLPAKQVKMYSFQAKLNFDKNYFTCTKVNYDGLGSTYYGGGTVKGITVPAAAGWGSMDSTTVEKANQNGYLTPSCATYKNASGSEANGTFGNGSEQTVAYYATFEVKNNVSTGSVTPFSISEIEIKNLGNDGTTTTVYNVGSPASISATVVQELSTVTLGGSITTPAKDGTDNSNVTGSNVSATVSWSPALETDNKFKANTEYTATVTVTSATGYVFADNVKFSGLGNDYNFKKQSDGSYTASHKFPATASKTVTALEITTGPTKTTYSHGDTFDTTGMVVKATYDDNSVDNDFKGYTIDNKVVKKDQTTVTLKCGNITTTQTITVGTKELSITGLKATDRNYDGTTTVALTGGKLDGVLEGDKVSVTMPTSGTITDANAGEGKDVTVTTPELMGDDKDNYTLANITGVKVNISKAPLTITAKDMNIVYGDALGATPSAVTYEYKGFVNSETDESVVTELTYDCDYTQFANAGTYMITPKGATATNYEITYVAGKLTVGQKPVTLTWSVTGNNDLYYDGKAKNVTATAGALVNEDTVGVTVVGGTAAEIGKYTAKAVDLTGEKAGNYKLPDASTQQYNIIAALNASDLTVKTGEDTVNTVTKTIDGLTIKLVGYATGEVTVSATDATVEGDKLTKHGVDYTIDKSGVTVIPTSVQVENSATKVKKPENADETITDAVVNAINNNATKGEGLNEAAAEKIAAAEKTLPEGAEKVKVKIELNIQPILFKDGNLKLDITPVINYTYLNDSEQTVGDSKTETLANSDIKAPVTISVKLPTGMTTTNLFAKHYLSNGGFEYLTVTVSGTDGSKVATWQQRSFSEVELISDSRSATVTFQKEDGSAVTKTYTLANLGEALPTDTKSGYTFNGWTVGEKTYTTLTDEALTAMAGLTSDDTTLIPSFTKKSSGHSGGGGSTVATTYDISAPSSIAHGSVSLSKTSAAANDKVTLTVKADKGYTLEVLKATDANGKEVALTAVKLGEEYTFVMPASKVSFEVSFMEDNSMLNHFVDVNMADYFYDAVLWAAEKKITTGIDDLHFAPEGNCTRAQIVTFLWRAAGSPEVTTGTTFSDVAADSYYAKAVAWAVANGITTGTEADKFSPDDTCTRAQSVTFLARALKGTADATADFSDVAADSYYASAVAWAKANGITTGVTESLFGPDNECTRAQIVTFLWRAYEK